MQPTDIPYADLIRIENKHAYHGPGVYCGRPSILGNPFEARRESQRDEVCEKYAERLPKEYKRGGKVKAAIDRLVAQYRRDGELTLICWCAPKRCHCEACITAEVES